PRHHALLALQVALLADGVAQWHVQVLGVDDGVVEALARPPGAAAPGVQLARAVTALAADSVAPEDPRAVAVQRALDVLVVVAVGEQTARRDQAAEVPVADFVTRRQVPSLVVRVPRQRRLEEVAVPPDEGVAARPRPGADREVGLLLDLD